MELRVLDFCNDLKIPHYIKWRIIACNVLALYKLAINPMHFLKFVNVYKNQILLVLIIESFCKWFIHQRFYRKPKYFHLRFTIYRQKRLYQDWNGTFRVIFLLHKNEHCLANKWRHIILTSISSNMLNITTYHQICVKEGKDENKMINYF